MMENVVSRPRYPLANDKLFNNINIGIERIQSLLLTGIDMSAVPI